MLKFSHCVISVLNFPAKNFVYIFDSCLFTFSVGQVTAEDKVRREIIQLLCIEPMTHSGIFEISRQKNLQIQLFVYNFIAELNKALTQDIVNHETGNFVLISRNFHIVVNHKNHSVKITEIYYCTLWTIISWKQRLY